MGDSLNNFYLGEKMYGRYWKPELPLALLMITIAFSVTSFLPVQEAQAALVIYSDTQNGLVSEVGGVGNGNIVSGDDSAHYWRGFVKFSLSGVAGIPSSATLNLYLYSGWHDGVDGGTVALPNIGLGDCRVFHIDDYETLDPTDFNAPSIGNDPGVLISSTATPDVGYLSIDITAALLDDLNNGKTFSAFMIRNTVDTDGDGKNDQWGFVPNGGEPTDQIPFISISYPAVGGIVISVNKVHIAMSFLALAGLVATASTLFIIKRRKD
ncbi:hypothetical protein ACFLQ6_00590 [Thermoproteota archaeon]